MLRTADRPLPAGRLGSLEVLLFSAVTIVVGFVYLAVLVNWLTAVLGLATWLVYVWIYTPLKTRTSANTAVGAVAGALPVLMGWASVGAPLGLKAFTLFLIVFLWQFPHFMAIAWIYRRQYAAAGLQMLPVVDPSGDAPACRPCSRAALGAGQPGAGGARAGRRGLFQLGIAVGCGAIGLCGGVLLASGRGFRPAAAQSVAGLFAALLLLALVLGPLV